MAGDGRGFLSLEDDEALTRCVRCGLCLPHCPTYREIGTEMASPRGRLALIKAVNDGRVETNTDFANHMYLCLECRACESACPSGVPFGRLMEMARARIEPNRSKSLLGRAARFVGFRLLLPHPLLLDLTLWPARLAQALGLRPLLRRSRSEGPILRRLRDLERMFPDLPMKAPGRFLPALIPPIGPMRSRVALFAGCVMDALFESTNRDTVEVLRRNGCEILIPRGQRCCGALHVREGRRAQGERLARRNVETFERLDVDAIVVNAAGCGSALKEYGILLRDDPEFSSRASAFAAKVRDVMEFLAALGLAEPPEGARERIVYEAPCHLQHAQQTARAPLKVLSHLPRAEVLEGPDSSWCCGSAGIYNLTHAELSRQMLDRKMKTLVPLGPDVITAGDPGCVMQLKLGAARWGMRARVEHPVEILARAYRSGG
jgi:glycolate oxidase iron-sulfur subunit